MATVTLTINQDVITELVGVLETHHADSDTLSRRLSRWGVEVLRMARSNRSATPDQIKQLALPQIADLRDRILVNPLNPGLSLREPLMERGLVWEKGDHKDCRELFNGKSPLDDGPMGENPPPHLFAREMIQWVATAMVPEASTQSAVVLSEGIGSLPPDARRIMYAELARKAKTRQLQIDLQERMHLALRAMDGQLGAAMRTSRELVAQAQARADGHEEDLRRRLDALESAHRDRVRAVEGQVVSMETAHRANVASLQARIAAESEGNRALADALRAQMAQLEASHRHSVAALGHQMDSLKSSHQQQVSNLQGDIARASGTVGNLQSELTRATQVNRQQQQETAQLRASLANAQAAVRSLQAEIDDDGGICCVM